MARSRKKRNRTKRGRARTLALLFISLGLALCLGLFFLFRSQPAEEKIVQPMPPPPSPAARLPEEVKKEKEIPPPALSRLALIIDDGGYSLEKLKGVTGAGRPITVAILPHSPHARKAALLARQEGAEVMLHLPMEPKESDRFSLETDTLLTGMDRKEIQEIVHRSLKQVPYARGVNNHMGSLATEDPRLMEALMEVLKKEGLYYIDSQTTPRTVGPRTARKAGVASGSNDRFLDHEKELETIKKAMRLAMKKAKKEGKAIAIGHPHPLTAQAIREMIPEIEGAGIRLVFASEVVE